MRVLWEAIEEFDPKTADPHFCWALLRMEEERYVRIKNGKVVPTGKAKQVSPQAILDRPAVAWECDMSKAMLIMESDGLLTINDGVFVLTDAGKQHADALIASEEFD